MQTTRRRAAVAHFETELARIAGVHDQRRIEADPAFCTREFVRAIAPIAHATLENTRDGGEKYLEMRIGNIIAVFVIAGLGATASAKESYKFDPSAPPLGLVCINSSARLRASSRVSRLDRSRSGTSGEFLGHCTIDMRSIDTRIKKRDDHLRSAEFL